MTHFKTLLFCLFAASACGQQPAPNRLGHCENPPFDREVAALLSFKIPALDVDSLRKFSAADSVLLLDAREPGEYAVSHLEGATHCGFDHFNQKLLESADKNRPVVVYCSIGYRSEKIAEKFRQAGFTRVYNLYGSIFEWVNRGYPLVDSAGIPTLRVHTFNTRWGKWVTHQNYKKVTKS